MNDLKFTALPRCGRLPDGETHPRNLTPGAPAMIILALDLGCTSRKPTKTYATILDTETGEIQRTSVPTSATDFLALIRTHHPARVVMEITRGTGWVVDLCRGAQIADVQIANPMDPAWQNRAVKTDRHDADLLARLSATGQLRTVHVPETNVREWRDLIDYRHRIVAARTRIKNRIKSIMMSHGLPTGKLWNSIGLASIGILAKPLSICDSVELWRGELHVELRRLMESERHVKTVEEKLKTLIERSEPAIELMKVDGIGERSAEIVVATIDNPLRFNNQKDIGAYFGLVPRVLQSGGKCIHGRITKSGDTMARTVLVEIVHCGIRRPGWIRDTYEKYLRDDPTRVKKAIAATARRLVVRLWAKMRDQRRQHPAVVTLGPDIPSTPNPPVAA
jgi:transposase